MSSFKPYKEKKSIYINTRILCACIWEKTWEKCLNHVESRMTEWCLISTELWEGWVAFVSQGLIGGFWFQVGSHPCRQGDSGAGGKTFSALLTHVWSSTHQIWDLCRLSLLLTLQKTKKKKKWFHFSRVCFCLWLKSQCLSISTFCCRILASVFGFSNTSLFSSDPVLHWCMAWHHWMKKKTKNKSLMQLVLLDCTWTLHLDVCVRCGKQVPVCPSLRPFAGPADRLLVLTRPSDIDVPVQVSRRHENQLARSLICMNVDCCHEKKENAKEDDQCWELIGVVPLCSLWCDGIGCSFPCVFSVLHLSSALHALPEHGGQRSHLHHLLPPVQGDATGQAAQQGGGHQDAAVDFHQVLPGVIFNQYMMELERVLWCATASTSTKKTSWKNWSSGEYFIFIKWNWLACVLNISTGHQKHQIQISTADASTNITNVELQEWLKTAEMAIL